MFSLSYLWHGVVLNDFNNVSDPMEIFLSFLSLLYIILGALMAFAYSFLADKKNPYLRGSLIGIAAGFIIFLIVFVLGASFSGQIHPIHATFDLAWQLIEQGIAGLTIAYIFNYIEQREMLYN